VFFVAMSGMAQHPDYGGYWNLNNNALDLSGNDSNGTINGTASWVPGKAGNAFEFNGSTSIDCGTDSSLSLSDNISIELWFYPEQWVTGYVANPISKWTSTADANYAMYFFGSTAGSNYKKIGFLANAGGTWKAVSAYYLIPTLNTWYHIVWTYNSVTGGKLYVNGAPYGTPTGSGVLATNVADLKLGRHVTPGFTGVLDEVKIHNKVLTPTEVQQKYQDANTRGSWNLNGNTLDFSGNDANGTITGAGSWAPGKVGKAFEFDGNSSIACGNVSSSMNDNISMELWFYPKQWVAGYAAYPIGKWTGTADANYVMYFFGSTAGANYKKIAFLANAGGVWKSLSPVYPIPALNTWYHIVWTYSSVSGGKLYINGTLYGSSAGSGTLATNFADLKLGMSLAPPGFTGILDEVRIYNRVLDAPEVLARYQDLGVAGAVLENNTLRLSLNSSGKITEVFGKSTGLNYSGGTVDFAKVKMGGVWYSTSSCLQKDGRLAVDFGDANVTAEIATKTKDSYFVFQVYSVYGETDGLEEMQLMDVKPYPLLSTYSSFMSGIKSDENFALAIRAMNPRSQIGFTSAVFPGICYPQYGGLALAKFGLLGSPSGNIGSALQKMITDEGLPGSLKGGPWALNAPENKYSYMFVFDLSPTNVGQYIALA
jgi:hypothetical protein